jgi:hypothetical protein
MCEVHTEWSKDFPSVVLQVYSLQRDFLITLYVDAYKKSAM